MTDQAASDRIDRPGNQVVAGKRRVAEGPRGPGLDSSVGT
jgi:hypothetical protein